MNKYLSPREIGEEALAAVRAAREDPEQHFQRLIDLGWINAKGEVTRLLGGDAEPEPTAKIQETPSNSEGQDGLQAGL